MSVDCIQVVLIKTNVQEQPSTFKLLAEAPFALGTGGGFAANKYCCKSNSSNWATAPLGQQHNLYLTPQCTNESTICAPSNRVWCWWLSSTIGPESCIPLGCSQPSLRRVAKHPTWCSRCAHCQAATSAERLSASKPNMQTQGAHQLMQCNNDGNQHILHCFG